MSDIRIDHGTWVLVADGEKALFLRNRGDAGLLDLGVRDVEEQENPPGRDQDGERPARPRQTAEARKSAAEADWQRFGKENFARGLADILYRKAHSGEMPAIVLVAPPHILGALRDAIHKEVRDRVVAEIPKDLTNHPVGDIEQVLMA